MKFQFDAYNHLVRLEKGELLVESLLKLANEQHIKGAWLSGLGAAQWAEVGFYDLPNKTYIWQKLDEPLEILNLSGNLAWNNEEPVLHIHGTFSNKQSHAFGGHVKELQVAGTCEVLLHRWYKASLQRFKDETTGLNILDV